MTRPKAANPGLFVPALTRPTVIAQEGAKPLPQSPAPGRRSSAEMTSRRLRFFKRWMSSNSIDFSDALRFVDDPESGISVISLCDLAVGDLVATIPKAACLTIRTSAAREMIEGAELDGVLGLSVAVMYERSLGSDSMWDGYLKVLPERECVPLVWSLKDVDSLLCGTELHKVVKEDKDCLYVDWKEHIQPLILAFKLDPSYFGVEQYFSAKSLVSSRSFEVDDYHGYGMVPLADLFNHKTEAENVHFTLNSSSSDDGDEGDISGTSDEDKSVIETLSSSSSGDNLTDSGDDPNTLEMIVVREVEAGAEVFNTYGTMGNAALLHRYGFTEPENKFDIVNIDLNLVIEWCSSSFSSRYSRARLSLWRSLNYSGCTSQDSEYFEISFNGEPQIELITLLYIIFLPEDACQKLNCAVDSFSESDESANLIKLINITGHKCDIAADKINVLLLTGDVCNALVSLADIRESLYGSNSLGDDENKLKRCCLVKERKLYHSLVLRVSERNILLRLRVYASKGCKTKKRKI